LVFKNKDALLLSGKLKSFLYHLVKQAHNEAEKGIPENKKALNQTNS
jgi:hypothetical protein